MDNRSYDNLRAEATRKLNELEGEWGFTVDESPVIVARKLGMSYETITAIRDPSKRPQPGTLRKVIAAWLAMKREQSGYEEQSTEDKRKRLHGFIDGMSPHGIERFYPLIMGLARRDMNAEINGSALDADDPFEAAMDEFLRMVLGLDQDTEGGAGKAA